MTFETEVDSTHDSDHTIDVRASFNQIAWQRSGNYDSSFAINISAL